MRDRRRVGFDVAKVAAIPVALLASGLLVLHGSSAAFSGTTSNPGNAWTTGKVALTDDDGGTDATSGTALFSATGLEPGSTGTRCIAVTSQSTVPATLKLYATGVTTTKAVSTYLRLTIEQGTGGSFADCTGFTAASTDFTGTLAAFAAKSDFSTGVGAYALAGTPPETRTYRVTYLLDSAAPNSTQDGTASANLVWEARA